MAQTAITQAMTTIKQVEDTFNLARTTDATFFDEWHRDLPDLTESEKAILDRVRGRFRYHVVAGDLAESIVNLVVLSPMLELAGFYEPPFRLRGEMAVELEVTTPIDEVSDRVLKGRLDFLVLLDRLWLVVAESKGTELNATKAIPQTLAYMMASPSAEQSVYGMVCNGEQFFFIKLRRGGFPEYDISRVFSQLTLQNELYDVLRVLKSLGLVVQTTQ
jgi:hypothetical protein